MKRLKILTGRLTLISFLLFLFINSKAQNCSVNAGTDKTICVTQQPLMLAGMAGIPQSSPAEYLWRKISGPGAIIANPNGITTDVFGLTPGNYVFELSNRCSDSLYARDLIDITVMPEPPTPMAGPDQMICNDVPISLSANAVPPGFTGAWTSSPAGVSFSPNANSPNAVFRGWYLVGTTTFVWTISNSACSKSDTVKVIVASPSPVIFAGNDSTIYCKGSCYVLNASYQGFSPPQSGQWTTVSGPNLPVFAYPNNNATKVCGLVAGDYTFRWTVSGPCKSGYDDVVLRVLNSNDPPSTLGDRVYAEFCEVPVVSSQLLTGAPLAAGETATWTQISGGTTATLSPTNHGSTVTVGNLTGDFPYKFTYSHTNAAGCTMTTSHTVYRCQPISALSEPVDEELPCNVTSTSFYITFDETVTTTHDLKRKTMLISGPSSSGIIKITRTFVTGTKRNDLWVLSNLSVAGTYIFRLQYENPCGSLFRDVAITVSRTPGSVNAGSDIILPCNSLIVNPIGSVNTPGTFYWTQASGPNTASLTGQSSLSLIMSNLTEGIYRMSLTNSGGRACPTRTDDMNVVVTRTSPAIATTGPDTMICAGNYRLEGNALLPTETGAWTVSPAGAVVFSPDANTANAVVSGLSLNTTYSFTWTVSNACGSTAATQILSTSSSFSTPIPFAGPDMCILGDTISVRLQGNNPGAAVALWTALTPGVSISSSNDPITLASFNEQGDYQFEYAMSIEGCATLRDTMTVTINENNTVAAGDDINHCTSTLPWSLVLNASVGNSAVGFVSSWRQLSGPSTAVLNTPLDPSSRVGASMEGIYEFEYSVKSTSDCPDIADTVVVRVSLRPSEAIAGDDRSVCNALPGTVITLAGTTPASGMGYWQVIDGPPGSPTPIFSDLTLATSTISNLTQGVYNLRWTVWNAAGCEANTDDMILSVASRASAGPDFSRCAVTNSALTANPNTNGTWTLVSGLPGTVINANSGNTAIVEGLVATASPTIYTFRYSLPANGSCPASFDDVILKNYPAASQAIAGNDVYLCSNENALTLSGNNPTIGSGSWVLESGPGIPSPGGTNLISTDTTITNLLSGIYVYKYVVRTNAICPASMDEIQIFKETVAIAQSDMRLCNLSTLALTANSPAYGQGTWSFLRGPGATAPIINDIHAAFTSVSGLQPGTYAFRWTIAGTATCAPSSDDVEVTIDAPVPPINAGNNRMFCQGAEVPFVIGQPASAGISYNWSPALLLSNPNESQPTFQGVNNPGDFTYTLKATNGVCEAFSAINIKVNPSPFAGINITNGVCGAGFMAATPGSGVVNPAFTWNFGSNASPSFASGQGPHNVVFPSSGPRLVSLAVGSLEGCNSADSLNYIPICSALPVTVTSFDAVWKSNLAEISWRIENQVNFSHFELEKSYDGVGFSQLKKLAYVPNVSRYVYPDKDVDPVINRQVFYRLKLVDLDNSFAYSSIKRIGFDQQPGLNVWPNPFDDRITISLSGLEGSEEDIILNLVNATGQIVVIQPARLREGTCRIEIMGLGKLSPGLYTLRVNAKKTKFENTRLLKIVNK